jgi:hypothetical protein
MAGASIILPRKLSEKLREKAEGPKRLFQKNTRTWALKYLEDRFFGRMQSCICGFHLSTDSLSRFTNFSCG